MFVIGTAGHVDHGKSTLVHALTGIDPDRLREEKERGLTIDLGFAWLQLPGGNEVSIVDVPGHERFVDNMLAGVGGIDLAMLVVAADESVMPQTREHVAILDLLHVRRGLVAITKRDLVDEDWIELVTADVEQLLAGTVLEGAPMVPVSATTRQGLPELLAAIQRSLEETEPRRDLGRPRLLVDRSFTIVGFGTVVTGTLVDGRLAVGQEAELVPSGRRTRIRGLQTHRRKVEEASPGTRVAVNLAGIAHDAIQRGEVLTTPGWLRASTAVDVRLRVLAGAPHGVRHNGEVSVYAGASETTARVRLLETQTAEPGQTTWAQLKLDRALAVVKGDYFVVRAGGVTLGGGSVVDTQGRRHRRMHAPVLGRLATMVQGTGRDVLLGTIEATQPSEFSGLVKRANLEPDAAREELTAMVEEGLAVAIGSEAIGPGSLVYTSRGWAAVGEQAREWLSSYHRRFPLRVGAPREELRHRLGLGAQATGHAILRLARDGALVDEGALLRLPDHRPRLSVGQEREAEAYLQRLEADPYSPPTDLSVDEEILNLLVAEGKVVRASDSVVFAAGAWEDMVERVRARIAERGETTVADVRDMFGTSRKYALALMDYLDQQRITRRVGDARVLR